MSLHSVISALPKTELHLHLIGSASVDTVLELAARQPDRGVPTDREALRRFYEFRDFPHFLEVYDAVDSLVTTPEAVIALVLGAARDAAASGVRWAELTVTANTHLRAGITAPDLRVALEEAREAARTDHGVQLGWIFDIPGERGVEAADETLAFLRDHAPEGTLALGLAGLESVAPRAMFKEHFDAARALGLWAVVHAGEITGPETVWSALRDLEADRIGHGTSAVEDPELVRHLAGSGVPVEVCVSSNVCTGQVAEPARHPVRELLAAEVAVCVSTDDPGMFGTDLDREYRLIAEIADLDVAGVCELATNGVTSSFAPAALRRELLVEIAEVAGKEQREAAQLAP